MRNFTYYLFTVIFTSFYFHSSRAQTCLSDGFSPTTQVEIDNFQTTYPGCTVIQGNVYINGAGITNLNGLSVITEIQGNLEIFNTSIASCQGLHNLTKIGGELELNTLSNLLQITDLIKLEEIGTLYINDCDLLSDLTGLNNLKTIYNWIAIFDNGNLSSLTGLDHYIDFYGNYIDIGNNPLLSVCDVQAICDIISVLGASADIYNNSIGCNSWTEVDSACLADAISQATSERGKGVAINTDGSKPDSSAILDIQGSALAMMIPRLSPTEIRALIDPQPGMTVYDKGRRKIYYYDGTSWIPTDEGMGDHNATRNIDMNQFNIEDVYRIVSDQVYVNDIGITKKLYDKNVDEGNPTQILSSTGTGVDWIDAPAGDNLGNHTAATGLNMNSNNVFSIGRLGVGTSNPQAAIQIGGSFGASSATQLSIQDAINGTAIQLGEDLFNKTAFYWNNAENSFNMDYIRNGVYDYGFTFRDDNFTLKDNLILTKSLIDINGQSGISGQVLSTTGSGVDWIDIPSGGSGDNLGNHLATQDLNMVGNEIALNGGWLSGDGDDEGIFVNNLGNIGIGTLNPSAELEINTNSSGINNMLYLLNTGTGDATMTLNSGSAPYSLGVDYSDTYKFKMSEGNDVSTNTFLTYDRFGHYLGIQTTNPTSTLDINGTVNMTGFKLSPMAGTNGYVLTSDGTHGTWQPVSAIGDNFGNHTANQNLKLSGYWLSGDGDNEGILVNNFGNVGISTNNPEVTLQLGGSLGSGASRTLAIQDAINNPFILIGEDISNRGRIYWQNNINRLIIDSYSGGTYHDNTLIIQDGKVGIGSYSSGDKLYVDGMIRSGSGGFKFPDGTVQTTAASGDNLGNHTASQNINLMGNWLSSDGTNKGISINSSGYVGINTSATFADLHIDAGPDDESYLAITTDRPVGSSNHTEIAFGSNYTASPNWAVIGQYHDGGLRLSGGSNLVNPDMIITDSGNVGIGTINPSTDLEINGQVKITGGSPGANKVLTSDGSGLATWESPSGDNLGNHTAIQDLNLAGNEITLNGGWLSGDGDEEGIYVHHTGRIGIGNDNPQEELQVGGSLGISADKVIALQDASYNTAFKFGEDSNNHGSLSYNTAQDRVTLSVYSTLDQYGTSISIIDDRVGIHENTPDASLHVKQMSGYGGIRIESSSDFDYWETFIDSANDYDFSYNGSIKSYIEDNDGSYNINSDIRLKEDISQHGPVKSKVLKLNPVNYRFKSSAPSSPISTGFIAQEVQELFPETVTEKNGYLSINYDAFAVIAIKAIQEQQEVIDQQQKTLDELIRRLEALENNK